MGEYEDWGDIVTFAPLYPTSIPVFIIPEPVPDPNPPLDVMLGPKNPFARGAGLFKEFDPTFLKEVHVGSSFSVPLFEGELKSGLLEVPNEARKLSMLISVAGIGDVVDFIEGAE